MDGYYKKKTYTTNRSILQAIHGKHIDRKIRMVERIDYKSYWEVVAFHRAHKDISKLFILQANLFWVEVELIIN